MMYYNQWICPSCLLACLTHSTRPNAEPIDVEPVESVEVEEPVDIGDSTADSDIVVNVL